MAEQCGNCRFFFNDGQSARCRRNPPYPFVIPATMMQPASVLPIWPNPPAEEWCGEWRGATGTVLEFPQRDPGDKNPGTPCK